MGRGFLCIVGVAVVALLLLTIATLFCLLMLLVQLVTLRYTLMSGAVALTLWFVNSRRQRYAKGFYSCSRVPQTQSSQQAEEKAALLKREQEKEEALMQMKAAVSYTAYAEMLSGHHKKVVTTPPSETESEDDDSEAVGAGEAREVVGAGEARKVVGEGEACINKKVQTNAPYSRHCMSLTDVRMRSHTTDAKPQGQEATRLRSSSAIGGSRFGRSSARGKVVCTSSADGTAEKRKIPRRRADTGMMNNVKQMERSRRATFASKQDVRTASSRSNSEDALRVEGYWIGDFCVQRRVVSRRVHHANSPKAK
ncbi:unnamed protein product [Peronospora belbahrii]|uniref:Uncharacterized protein n=1 Tax=Peronospora belbahrii TaxID=622444 RepID=A0AAU9KPQ8_9STRA|nr:unnamed protein product [Peronospora belbahrii]CAH0521638.1 unnamed protein product [Peronospora belbahrii]